MNLENSHFIGLCGIIDTNAFVEPANSKFITETRFIIPRKWR